MKQALHELGARQVRRRAQPRRQGLPPGRQDRGDPQSAGLRPGRREQPHLDRRLGDGELLERLRRQPRNARQGRVLRSRASTMPRNIPVAARTKQGHKQDERRPDHRQAAGAALLSAVAADARSRPTAAFDQRRRARAEKLCSTARPHARPATCRRCSPSRAGTSGATKKGRALARPSFTSLSVPAQRAVDALVGHVADLQPRQAEVGQLAVVQRSRARPASAGRAGSPRAACRDGPRGPRNRQRSVRPKP